MALTTPQKETLLMMDYDTGYSSSSIAHRRVANFGAHVSVATQRKVLMRMRELGLVMLVPDYSGDLWAREVPN